MNIQTASVKVMRSFDYCHFEVVLGTSASQFTGGQTIPLTTEDVDALRKEAARLADKAVAQYKIAKANAEKREAEKYDRAREVERMANIRGIAEGDRTVSQQAALKAHDDKAWAASREYDYEDDWNDDN